MLMTVVLKMHYKGVSTLQYLYEMPLKVTAGF